MNAPDLLDAAERGVARALALGAEDAEVFVTSGREISVELQKNDVHSTSTVEETTFGVRVFKGRGLGFATANGAADLSVLAAEALALAEAAPPDPQNGLAAPRPILGLDARPDPAIADLQVDALIDLANLVLERIAAHDRRVIVDRGSVTAHTGIRGLVTSTGIRAAEESATAGGSLFGMAVDGKDVGSFDTEGHAVRQYASLEHELRSAADRFVIKTLAGLGAKRGESFRGPIVLVPEVVLDFVLANLLAVLDGRAVRTGKSPFTGRLGEPIAAPVLDLVDDARRPGGVASMAFDREGTPTRALPILRDGRLENFLYDTYEARAAGREPTGHARGGAGSLPHVGPSNLVLRAGDTPFTRLCCDPEICVVVSRFSGSCNPVTGEFSGVVKGGFLLRRGERTPIKETLIAGNLYHLLESVSGVSAEIRDIGGHAQIPSLRVEDVSVTAG